MILTTKKMSNKHAVISPKLDIIYFLQKLNFTTIQIIKAKYISKKISKFYLRLNLKNFFRFFFSSI